MKSAMNWLPRFLCLVWLVGAACGGQDATPFDLATALQRAAAGDVVTVPPGDYPGPVTVPAGVTIRVATPGTATVTQTTPGAAVTVRSSAGTTTTVEGLRVDTQGTVGMLVVGDGAVALRDVDIEATRGFGLLAEGPSSLTAERIVLVAHIDNPQDLRYPIDPALFPAVGLGLSRIGEAQLTNPEIAGFAGFGAVLSDSAGTWTGGTVHDNLGVGVLQQGGDWQLTGLSVTGTVNCEHASCAVSNQVFALALVGSGADQSGQLTTSDLDLSANRGIAFFQQGGASRHANLQVLDNQQVGVWLQDLSGSDTEPSFALTGDGTELSGNGGAGIVALRSSGVRLEDVAISGTTPLPVPVEQLTTTTMADGIQVSAPLGDVTLRNVTIDTDNSAGSARVGLLLDRVPDASSHVIVDNVAIQGQDGDGLILQGGTVARDDWSVAVSDALNAHDQAFTGTLDVAAVRTGVPSAAVVGENGLVGPLGVVGENGLVGPAAVVGENGVVGAGDP